MLGGFERESFVTVKLWPGEYWAAFSHGFGTSKAQIPVKLDTFVWNVRSPMFLAPFKAPIPVTLSTFYAWRRSEDLVKR